MENEGGIKMKFIKNWSELEDEKSPTHYLEIDQIKGCGWILSKYPKSISLGNNHYLPRHTFYSDRHEKHSKKTSVIWL